MVHACRALWKFRVAWGGRLDDRAGRPDASDPMSASRRAEVVARMGEGVAIFPAPPVALRNGDVEHEFRQSSDLFYLTAFDEPESVAVLSTAPNRPAFTLFCRVRDPDRETWDGPRAGLEGALRDYGADASFEIGAL